jgi:RNA polymerase sigma factor (sigma-70 family)
MRAAEHRRMPSWTAHTNAALVRAASAGDDEAWRALIQRYDGLIGAVCRKYRISDADAADVKQTTWMRAFEHLDRLQHPERIGAWLATVARRESLRALRNNARVYPSEDDFLHRQPDPSAIPDARLVADERVAAVRGAVVNLTQRDRTLLGLLFTEPRPSYDEIARALQIPIGSIGPTRGRALARVRRHADVAGLAAAA